MMTRKFSADECVEYMRKKYGREFSFVRTADAFQPTERSLEIFVFCPDFPGEDILAVEEDTGESLRFSDNFPAVMFDSEVRSFITELAVKAFGECRVLYRRLSHRIVPGSPASAEEYLSDSRSCVSFTVLLPPGTETGTKDAARSLAADLCAEKAACTFVVYCTSDRSVYDGAGSLKDIPGTRDWYSACGHLRIDGSALTLEAWR